jgi:hypothetical protein
VGGDDSERGRSTAAPNTETGSLERMPESGRRVFSTQRIRFSKVVRAPLAYAYDWFTDYRDDDGKFSDSKPRFKVTRLARNRVLRVRFSGRSGRNPRIAVEIVRLRPPAAWHVDQIDETDLAAVDYRLRRLGPKTTRVELDIVERWMTPKYPAHAAYAASTSEYWDRLVSALEARYERGRPARG